MAEADSPTEVREIQLAIRGMTCAACAARVQRKLGEIPDVLASVNLATEKATVSVPPSVSVDLLVATVERAGYGAELARPAMTAGLRRVRGQP